MKNTISILALAAIFTACGSQVVEFPVDDQSSANDAGSCNCADSGKTNPPSSSDNPSAPLVPVTPSTPSDNSDGGTTVTEDSGSHSEADSGDSKDSGASDCGKPETDVCGKNHGQCVSACAHKCNGHKNSCPLHQSCFKACKESCDCDLKKCKDKEKEEE